MGNIAVPAGGDKLTVDVRGTGGDNLCVNVAYIIIKTVPVDVDADMAALTLPESVKNKLALPASGKTGSVITWSSSMPEVLSNDGKVLKHPLFGEPDVVVTMTASVSDGETTKEKGFKVTVPALAEGEDPSLLLELGFNDNTLTDSSIYEREVEAVGTANYTDGEGANGRALTLNNTYLNLGKDLALTPEKLTVSFWMKPNAAIESGQIIAWNKGAWYSDGWYLNVDKNAALGLSVGPAAKDGQPHFIKTTREAAEFFPLTEWTHVVVTYDSDTKEACIYRNGIPQKTTVGYPMSETSTGVIGANNNINVIGCNGEVHNYGDKLNAALDEYCLYNRVLDAEEVIALYDESGRTFSKKEAAQMELDALAVDTTDPLITEIALPEKGDFGSAITWSANGSKYLSDKGEVLERPALGSEDVEVTLTATASYLGGEPATKDFTVTVKAIAEGENPSLLLDLGFDEENLADDSIYSRKVQNVGDVAYVAGVDGKGKAVSLNGSTYLNLGTSNKLTPEVLSLSFWIKPNAVIGASEEQIVAWSKGAYNSDGWYLNMKANAPLGLSVGPANSQPYFIQVNGTAKDFFPTDAWTHVAVTYNSKTKKAMFYRNGIPQKTTVGYPVTNTASGVIGTNSNIKVIGSNGEVHGHGGKLNAALDEYQLYNTEFTLEQVVAAYEESGRTLNKQEIAQQDIDALEVPQTVEDELTLAKEGESGSVVTWESNDPAIVVNGTTCTITPPGYGEEDKVVTLTAKAVFAGGTPATKEFPVTVKAKKADFSKLEKAIQDAADYETEDAYTPESYQAFQKALKDAKDVAGNKASSQEAVDGAVSALETAIAGLEENADPDAKPNKALLKRAIETAKARHEALYTAESWSDMQTALTEANRVNADEDATRDDVNSAKQALEEAVANLADDLALNLAFEDNLTDGSANAFEVAGSKAVTYTDGVKGKAVSLDGSTYLNLGTNGKLSPGKLSLSFWINPSQKMAGECSITWNKKQWYTDGW